jgi:hypothetical protein
LLIRIITLIRIRIQLFTLMRIRIQLLFKVMGFCDHESIDHPGLQFDAPGLHRNPALHGSILTFEPLKLWNFDLNADPYLAFHPNTDADLASNNNADLDLQP